MLMCIMCNVYYVTQVGWREMRHCCTAELGNLAVNRTPDTGPSPRFIIGDPSINIGDPSIIIGDPS